MVQFIGYPGRLINSLCSLLLALGCDPPPLGNAVKDF